MEKFKELINKKSGLNSLLLSVAFIITLLSIFTGSYISDTEKIEIGSISPKRYIATRAVENTIGTDRLKETAISSLGPLYQHNEEVQNASIEDIRSLFSEIDKTYESSENIDKALELSKKTVLKIPVILTEVQYRNYYQLTESGKEQYQDDIIKIAKSILDQGITEENISNSVNFANELLDNTQWNSSLKNMAHQILSSALKPNLVIDEEAMEAALEQKLSEIEPVMLVKDQKIVDEGEVITHEIFLILNDLNLVNQDYSRSIIPLLGSSVIVLLIFVTIYLYFLSRMNKEEIKSIEICMIFVSYVFMIVITRIMSDVDNFEIIPIYLFAMLVSILIGTRIALILNIFVCIIGAFIFNGDMQFLIYFTVLGSFASILMQYTYKRDYIFIVSLAMGLISAITFMAVAIFFENGYSKELLNRAGISAILGLLSIILVVGSLPFWEAVFGVNTPFKLLELTNPNNELLRRLMIEAPGTYHHSLIVANLAETAAYDIYANAVVARVGAYYHDIGKLKRPRFFSENQYEDNIHDRLKSRDSAKIIIGHVKYGIELAEESSLPNVIKDIIVEHHGNTIVKYFYYKALKENENSNTKTNENDFRYPGPIPQTKESAIVMLADTVEAAIRATITNCADMKAIDEQIRGYIKDKLDDGQLNDCGLNLKELEIIKKSFLKVFHGMYHGRIDYPKADEIEKIKKCEQGNIASAESGEVADDSFDR